MVGLILRSITKKNFLKIIFFKFIRVIFLQSA